MVRLSERLIVDGFGAGTFKVLSDKPVLSVTAPDSYYGGWVNTAGQILRGFIVELACGVDD